MSVSPVVPLPATDFGAGGSGRRTAGAINTSTTRDVRTVLWVARFIGARGLAQPVSRCKATLDICLRFAMFGIAQMIDLGGGAVCVRRRKISTHPHHAVCNNRQSV